jgi:transposase
LAYSLDLRQRVVETVREEEITQESAAIRFKVSLNSVKRWLKREKLEADKPGPRQSRTILPEELREAVNSKPDGYLDEYAKMLKSTRSTIFYNLKKLGISRKKNHTLRRKK